MLGLVGGCAESFESTFQCNDSEQCRTDQIIGSCEPTGFCSFPHSDCVSGQRYGELAPAELAGKCTCASTLAAHVYVRIGTSYDDALYTVSLSEANAATNSYGYIDEGIAFRAAEEAARGRMPVYRLYNPQTRDRLWTTDADEASSAMMKWGYTGDEGIGFYVASAPDACTIPVTRLANDDKGVHRFATSAAEVAALLEAGYVSEGVRFHAAPKTATKF